MAPARAKLSDRLRLLLDVGVKPAIVVTPQSFLDQGAQNDLEAHGEFEGRCRLSGQDPGPDPGRPGEE